MRFRLHHLAAPCLALLVSSCASSYTTTTNATQAATAATHEKSGAMARESREASDAALAGGVAEAAASAMADSARRGHGSAALAPVTAYVVRHAEAEQNDSRDPVLTQAGVVRANALRDRLRGAGIDAIFSTAYIRTRETAAPLAAALDLPVQIYDARDPATLVQDLYANHRGRRVLIVGHSNTVPAVIEALGGTRPADLGHTEHDPLFRVEARGTGLPAKVTRLRYGAKSDTTGH